MHNKSSNGIIFLGILALMLFLWSSYDYVIFWSKLKHADQTTILGFMENFKLGGIKGLLPSYFIILSFGIFKRKNYVLKWAIFYPVIIGTIILFNPVFNFLFNPLYPGKSFEFIYIRENKYLGFIVDFICSLLFLYFFTRPKVKEQFR